MKLSWKFGGAVLLVVTLAMGVRAWWLIKEQRRAILEEAQERAATVLSFGEACRQYARETLSPAVRAGVKEAAQTGSEPLIFPADSATFVARGTFEALRQKLPAYSFREAALNPLSKKNLADAEETKLIQAFQNDPQVKELSGFKNTPEGEVYYVARPIVVQKNCLQCHDSPETAPPELVRAYGKENGYGWKVGDLTSAIIVTVPAHAIYEEQSRTMGPALLVFVGLGLVLVVVIYWLFDRLVHRRLHRLGAMMVRVAKNPMTMERLVDRSRDELGVMAQTFNNMADSLAQSHEALESRVQERTAALVQAKDELEKENLERRRTQEELQRTGQELARSNSELEQFAYVASHDLQEPLRMVSSYMDLLSQRYRHELDEKAQRWIEFAVDGANRMKQLISDLLEWSRVGSRGQAFVPTDCNQVLKTVQENLQVRLQETGATLQVGPLPVVTADPQQLTQLFQNLINNSLKYRGSEPPVVHVQAVDRGHEWEFSVRDNGIGIDPQYFERIFIIFQRLHTRQEYPGTGIGLALCKKVVERHGGRIWVESQPGQGTTFYFTVAKHPTLPTEGGKSTPSPGT